MGLAVLAFLLRRRRERASLDLASASLGVALRLLIATPSKWPWHFGALVGIAAVAVASETIRLSQGRRGRTRLGGTTVRRDRRGAAGRWSGPRETRRGIPRICGRWTGRCPPRGSRLRPSRSDSRLLFACARSSSRAAEHGHLRPRRGTLATRAALVSHPAVDRIDGRDARSRRRQDRGMDVDTPESPDAPRRSGLRIRRRPARAAMDSVRPLSTLGGERAVFQRGSSLLPWID